MTLDNSLCCLCLKCCEIVLNIYEEQSNNESLAEIISQHFWFDINKQENSNMKYICVECWSNIDKFHAFYNLVCSIHHQFTDMENVKVKKQQTILENSTECDVGQFETLVVNEIHEFVKTKMEEVSITDINERRLSGASEILEVMRPYVNFQDSYENNHIVAPETIEDTPNHNCPSISFDYLNDEFNSDCNETKFKKGKLQYLKIEHIRELLEPTDEQFKFQNNDDSNNSLDSDVSLTDTEEKRTEFLETGECVETEISENCMQHQLNSDDTLQYEARKLIALTGDNPVSNDSEYKAAASSATPEIKASKKRRITSQDTQPIDTSKITKENELIRALFIMECEICFFHFHTFSEAQRHYRSEHKIKGYLKCCNTKFKTRPTVMEHVRRHENPDEFKCDQCDKYYVNIRYLLEHKGRMHLSAEEKPFKCSECPKSFIRKVHLVSHMESHKNLPKCVCNECGKEYGNKVLLGVHKRHFHDQTSVCICDVCAKKFKTKSEFDKHYRNVHQTSSKIQCKVCGTWLKSKVYLKQHMFRHQERSILKCNECGKTFPFRKTLVDHMRLVHPKEMLECDVCNKQFKTRISLREHIASHTGLPLYNCPQCPKTFTIRATMYAHRKKMHKAEWEEHLKLKADGLKYSC